VYGKQFGKKHKIKTYTYVCLGIYEHVCRPQAPCIDLEKVYVSVKVHASLYMLWRLTGVEVV